MKSVLACVALLIASPTFGQVSLQPRWVQVPPSSEDIARGHAVEGAQAVSPGCRQMHIGCPEGKFTRPTDYSRSEFTRDCRALAPKGRGHASWLASCKREAP